MQEVIYEPSAETAMLSCLCHASVEQQKEIITQIKEDHFYLNEHKIIYSAAIRAIGRGHQADWVNIKNDLESAGQLDVVGGNGKIAEIATFCPSANNWKRYYPKLEEARYRRSLEFLASDMVHKARDREMGLSELKNWSETSVMKADYLLDEGNHLSISEPLERAVSNIESTMAGKPQRGLPVGMAALDELLLFGLRGGDMVVLAARPAVGKTTAAMQIAEHAALELRKRVLIFSLEMTSVALMERMIRSRAGVSAADILSRQVTEHQKKNLSSAYSEIQNSSILCDDNSGKSMGYIKAISRRAHQKEPLDLIIIDYLQLVKGDSKRGRDNRVCEVEEISGGIKELAKTLRVPVLVLAQLNRDPDKRGGRPSLSDLKGSGAIEQDADIVVILHCDEEDAKNHEQNPTVEFVVAKQREGPTGIAPMSFSKAITRFEPSNTTEEREDHHRFER
jgi:replicative DNA helicase